jgi:hypothetical protein
MGNKMVEGGSVTRTIAVEGEEEDGVGQEGMLYPSFLINFPPPFLSLSCWSGSYSHSPRWYGADH